MRTNTLALALAISFPSMAMAQQAAPLQTPSLPPMVMPQHTTPLQELGPGGLPALEKRARQYKLAGGLLMGFGFPVQSIGAAFFVLWGGLGNPLNPGSSASPLAYGVGLPLFFIGTAAAITGATLVGYGAAYGRTAERVRTATWRMPSVAPLVGEDRRSLIGATAAWQFQF